MAESKGWIKLYRQILECDLWIGFDDETVEPFDRRSAWIDLLLRANHSDKEILFNSKPMTITRGQLMTSVRKLSTRWGWSVKKTYNFLDMLVKLGMVTKDSDYSKTLLTIVNYAVYQSDGNTEETEKKHEGNTKETQSGHKQEDISNKLDISNKNDKNDKKERVYFPNDELLNEAFKEFVLMRKKIKKPLATDHAIDLVISKLNKLSGGNNEKAIEILNQSIENSWQGIFEVKSNSFNNNKSANAPIDWSKI